MYAHSMLELRNEDQNIEDYLVQHRMRNPKVEYIYNESNKLPSKSPMRRNKSPNNNPNVASIGRGRGQRQAEPNQKQRAEQLIEQLRNKARPHEQQQTQPQGQHVAAAPGDKIILKFKTLRHTSFELTVGPKDLISDIKVQIQAT